MLLYAPHFPSVQIFSFVTSHIKTCAQVGLIPDCHVTLHSLTPSGACETKFREDEYFR